MYWINTDEHTECIGHTSNEQNDNKWVEADEYSRAREAANLYRSILYQISSMELGDAMERFAPTSRL